MKYNIQNFLFGLLVSIFFMQAGNTTEKTNIRLGTYYVPGVVDSSKEGMLILALKEIEEISPLKIEVYFTPVKRVQAMFRKMELIGYFPELDDFAPKDSCKTSPFAYKDIYVFWLKGHKPAKNIEDMYASKVGIVSGFSYGDNIKNNERLMLDEASDDDVNIRKLLAGRVDYILGDARSTGAAIQRLDVNKRIDFNAQAKIVSLPVFFVFQSNDEGKAYCMQMSNAINKIMASGGFVNFK